MSIIRTSTLVKTSVAAACCLIASGCAIDPKTGQPSFKETFASDNPCANNARNIGILAGTIAGGLIGSQIDKKSGIFIGAGVGALLGGVIGADMDRKKCALSKLAKKYDLEMTVSDIQLTPDAPGVKADSKAVKPIGLSVSITDKGENGHFKSGSDELSPNAAKYFAEIAAEYSYRMQMARLSPASSAEDRQVVESLKEKRVLIVGHTDDTGNSRLNADLSERRANAVARIFRAAGVNEANIYFQGAGETLPIADNRLEEGRAKNRRVEIVEVTDQANLKSYLATRPVRTDFYRITPVQSPAAPMAALPTRRPATQPGIGDSKQQAATELPKKAEPKGASIKKADAGQPASPVRIKDAASQIDFGGSAVSNKPVKLDIGQLVTTRTFVSLISTAQADDLPPARSCMDDHPRIANGVKSLRDSKEYSTSEYMPGLYDTSWTDTVNGHLVALTHVAVLRDGGAPARNPQLLVYKDYSGHAAKSDYSASPEVNAYKGEKAVLYRVFINGPVRCMDIVIPNATPTEATGSWLYYDGDGKSKVAPFHPKLVKT